MKFDLVVRRNRGSIRKWGWAVFDPNGEPVPRWRDKRDYPTLYGSLGWHKDGNVALDWGTAFTCASADRKAQRAARRLASCKGTSYEYKAKAKDADADREEMLETIAKLEEELGL